MDTVPQQPASSPDETILGECAHCRLPVYASDHGERISAHPWDARDLYHPACAWRVQVRYWEQILDKAVLELRTLQCHVTCSISRPAV